VSASTLSPYHHNALSTCVPCMPFPAQNKSIFHKDCLAEMWSLLRDVVVHHMQPLNAPDRPAAEAAMSDAAKKLRRFSALAEQHFGRLLCKSNLHALNCRLLRQQLQRGHTVFYGEWWVETMVQVTKSIVKYRNTQCPELVVVNWLLLRRALANLRFEHPEHAKDLEEWFPDIGATKMCGANLDESDSHQMLGSGRFLSRPAEVQAASRVLRNFIINFAPVGWRVGMVAGSRFYSYTHAHVVTRDSMVIHSTSYRRARSRVS
jgi:hypothetical protein